MDQCGEFNAMSKIKVMVQKDKSEYYFVVEKCKPNGNTCHIYKEDLFNMLNQLMRKMDNPKMDCIDFWDLYKIASELQRKLSERLQKECERDDPDNSLTDETRERGSSLLDVSKKTLGNLLETGKEKSSSLIRNFSNAKKTEKEPPLAKIDGPNQEEYEEAVRARWRQETLKKEEERCKARVQAERELAEEKAKYSKAKRIEIIYNEKIQPLVQPFLKLTESLIYFAGCLNAEDFSTRKRILSNRQQLLCSNLQASTWGFSLDREAFQGVDEMLAAMSQETKLPELPQKSDPLTAEEYLQKKQETEKLKRQYLLENEKLRLNEFRQKQILEYICLFRELYPVVTEICAESQTDIEEQWAISIGREIVRIVDQHQSRNASMKFIFVYPDNEAHTQNESVKIDFIAAEADCPGLYYRDSSGELICVIPGRVK